MNHAARSSRGSAAAFGWRAWIVVLAGYVGVALLTLPASAQTPPTSTTSAPSATEAPAATDPPAPEEPLPPAPDVGASQEPPATEPTSPPVQELRENTSAAEAPAAVDTGGIAQEGPLTTTADVLVEGNGLDQAAQETTTTTAPKPEEGDSGSDSERRTIWMITAGLGAVALLVALLTWRYWLLTRPGLDLDEDEAEDGYEDYREEPALAGAGAGPRGPQHRPQARGAPAPMGPPGHPPPGPPGPPPRSPAPAGQRPPRRQPQPQPAPEAAPWREPNTPDPWRSRGPDSADGPPKPRKVPPGGQAFVPPPDVNGQANKARRPPQARYESEADPFDWDEGRENGGWHE